MFQCEVALLAWFRFKLVCLDLALNGFAQGGGAGQDGNEITISSVSALSAERLWAAYPDQICIQVLWYRLVEAGHGLPASHAPYTASQVGRVAGTSSLWCCQKG